jgi:hypothetical protein
MILKSGSGFDSPRTPLIPKKAGIQLVTSLLGPRFRGDERRDGLPFDRRK